MKTTRLSFFEKSPKPEKTPAKFSLVTQNTGPAVAKAASECDRLGENSPYYVNHFEWYKRTLRGTLQNAAGGPATMD